MKNWKRARAEMGITIPSSIQIFPKDRGTAACTRFQPKSPKIRMTRSMWTVVAEKATGVVHASLLLLKLMNVVVHAAITSRIAATSYDVELRIDVASGVLTLDNFWVLLSRDLGWVWG
ncbi:hypothetical protein KY289_023285 [Solanum tuberosum]|nr:hypothetical protein KY289_023285 [Solanum tuberosum]